MLAQMAIFFKSWHRSWSRSMEQRTTTFINIEPTTMASSEKWTRLTTHSMSHLATMPTSPLESTNLTLRSHKWNFSWVLLFFWIARILFRTLFGRVYYILKRSTITQDETPPDYVLERRNASKVLMAVEQKHLRQLRRVGDIKVLPGTLPFNNFLQGEHWYGRLGPCSPLRLPLAGTKLGWGVVWNASIRNKGDSLKLKMSYKATYHPHHSVCAD